MAFACFILQNDGRIREPPKHYVMTIVAVYFCMVSYHTINTHIHICCLLHALLNSKLIFPIYQHGAGVILISELWMEEDTHLMDLENIHLLMLMVHLKLKLVPNWQVRIQLLQYSQLLQLLTWLQGETECRYTDIHTYKSKHKHKYHFFTFILFGGGGGGGGRVNLEWVEYAILWVEIWLFSIATWCTAYLVRVISCEIDFHTQVHQTQLIKLIYILPILESLIINMHIHLFAIFLEILIVQIPSLPKSSSGSGWRIN